MNELALNYNDILLYPNDAYPSQVDSREDVDLNASIITLHSKKVITGVPVIASNMDHVGTFEMANLLTSYNMFTALQRSYTVEEIVDYYNNGKGRHHTIVSIGIGPSEIQRLGLIYDGLRDKTQLKYLMIDVANGYTRAFLDMVESVRKAYPNIVLIAGNVCTPEATRRILRAGADIVKVGVGQGAACTTRLKTGIGFPQFSAVLECGKAAEQVGGHIIADGGITCPGDAVKAFAAGADFVMMGHMFAGFIEGYSPEFIAAQTSALHRHVPFYGMASAHANEKYHGGLRDYRSAEGRYARIPLRGYASTAVRDILGGIRSACTYLGARSIESIYGRALYTRVTDPVTRTLERDDYAIQE